MGRLILTRRTGQTIHIGDDITVTVVGIRGKVVALGIHAPRGIPVHRREVYEAIQRERIREGLERELGKLPPAEPGKEAEEGVHEAPREPISATPAP